MRIKNLSSVLLSCVLLILSAPALSEISFPEFPSKNKPLIIKLQTEFFQSNANFIHEWNRYQDLKASSQKEENFFQYIAFKPKISYSPLSQYISFDLFADSFYASSRNLGVERQLPFRPSLAGVGLRYYHKIKQLYSGFELYRSGLRIA